MDFQKKDSNITFIIILSKNVCLKIFHFSKIKFQTRKSIGIKVEFDLVQERQIKHYNGTKAYD